MAKSDQPTTIKKYANRRLYNTGTSTYVTLEDLAAMVKEGEDFLVYDAKTGDDITRSVLAQIIFEQENKAGQNLLPTTFLRQLIRFYGDSMQMVVPRYLEQSIDTLTREQEKFRKQLTTTFSMTPFAPLEEHVRRNMEMFERTFSMFKPFAAPRAGNAAAEPLHPIASGFCKCERWRLSVPTHARCRRAGRRPGVNILVTMLLSRREQPTRSGITLAMKKLKRAWRPKT
jgi:polyhydroxyalkanoate synthesis repressor PhaR